MKDFFKKYWRELLVWTIFSTISLALLIAAPYLLPVAYSAAIFASAGTTAAYFILTSVIASVIGFAAGLFTHLIRSCLSSGKEGKPNVEISPEGSQQPAMLYAAMASPPPPAYQPPPTDTFIPLQTNPLPPPSDGSSIWCGFVSQSQLPSYLETNALAIDPTQTTASGALMTVRK